MLNFFNKTPVCESFTTRQRLTITALILGLCTYTTNRYDEYADDSQYAMNNKEKYANKVAKALEVRASDLQPFAEKKMEENLAAIQGLNLKQTEWLALTVYEAMVADGRPTREEIFLGTSILNSIGIDLEKHKEIINRLWSIDNIGGHLSK